MSAIAAFQQTILAEPEADSPRLVFADWLEEQGEPQAELVRIQCALAHLRDDDSRKKELQDREAELLEQHHDLWLGPLFPLALSGRFRRGFLEVSISGIEKFLDFADEILAIPWVLEVHLRDSAATPALMRSLVASEHLSRIRSLDLSRSRLGNTGMELLCRTRVRCRPVSLLFSSNNISSRGLQSLLQGFDLSRLEELRLSTNGIGEQGVLDLSRCPQCTGLRTLDLSYNRLGSVGGEYLAESRYLSRLQALYVRGTNIGARGKKALRRRFGPRVHMGNLPLPF